MIKAIVFDCFGVLTTDLWLDFRKNHFSHDAALDKQASILNRQSDLGKISYDDFIQQVAALAGISPSKTRLHIEGNVPNEQLFDYIRSELRPKYKIGMLSNAASNWLDQIFTPEQIKLFDAIVLSYATGFIKPQPEIYQLTAKKLGLGPSECMLIDDREMQLEGARRTGMYTIQYKNFLQMKGELDAILGSS